MPDDARIAISYIGEFTGEGFFFIQRGKKLPKKVKSSKVKVKVFTFTFYATFFNFEYFLKRTTRGVQFFEKPVSLFLAL